MRIRLVLLLFSGLWCVLPQPTVDIYTYTVPCISHRMQEIVSKAQQSLSVLQKHVNRLTLLFSYMKEKQPAEVQGLFLPVRSSCTQHYLAGTYKPGVLKVKLLSNMPLRPVWCSQDWMVIHRSSGRRHFNRTWEDYRRGFGSVIGTHWLGNELVHQLTAQTGHVLCIVGNMYLTLPSCYDFKLGSERTNYTLMVEKVKRNAGVVLDQLNGSQFVTMDRAGNCAGVPGFRAWWYKTLPMCYFDSEYGWSYHYPQGDDKNTDFEAVFGALPPRYIISLMESHVFYQKIANLKELSQLKYPSVP